MALLFLRGIKVGRKKDIKNAYFEGFKDAFDMSFNVQEAWKLSEAYHKAHLKEVANTFKITEAAEGTSDYPVLPVKRYFEW